MLDRGVGIGDMSPRAGGSVQPWDLTHEEALRRVAEEVETRHDEADFIDICWFEAPAGR